MSPDFPTVGSVITDLFPQSGGTPLDGVVAVDPDALQALLTFTGPIQVAGWPEPVGADNVVAVTLHSAYLEYTDETQRANFLGTIAQDAFRAFDRLDINSISRVGAVLAPVVSQQDVQIYSTQPAEETFLKQVGLAGEIPPVRSSSVSITTQNAAANKIDYYLHRSIRYQVSLDPQGNATDDPSRANVAVGLTLGLKNTAPDGGLPPSIIGPYSPQFQAGEEATFLSIYSSLEFHSADLDGIATSLSSGNELGRNVYSSFIDIPAGKTATLSVSLAGTSPLLPGGWYELDIPHQPVVNLDQVTVDITVADGWRVTGVRGGTEDGPDTVSASFSQSTDRSVWVRVAPGSEP
jgi:hypothetical protein